MPEEETLLHVEDYIDGKLHVFDQDSPSCRLHIESILAAQWTM